MAEFFRLGLLAGLCQPATVIRWADAIVAAEQSPHIAFIELCIAGGQSPGHLQSLLADVPGDAATDLPVRMLLGHATRLLQTGAYSPEQLILRLYGIARAANFPERIYFELVALEDDYSLVRDGVYGRLEEVVQDLTAFLHKYGADAPDHATGIA